jgi:hypothetical protein
MRRLGMYVQLVYFIFTYHLLVGICGVLGTLQRWAEWLLDATAQDMGDNATRILSLEAEREHHAQGSGT